MSAQAPRVLLLEDDDALRESMAKMLLKRGYHVDQVGSGLDAVKAAAQSSYDLIVTDIRMEGMDGLEALEKVKEAQPDIGSLVVTGYSTEEDSIRAIRLGVGDYLKKPFRLPSFLDSVGQILERRKTRTADTSLMGTVFSLIELLLAQSEAREAVGACETARLLAEHLGLTQGAQDWVRVGVLAKALQNTGRQLKPGSLPDRLASALEAADGPWSEAPLEARILATALQLHTQPEEYDPEVMAALDQIKQSGEGRSEDSPQRLRGLLSVAEALVQKGQLEAAEMAFSKVLEHGKGTRQGVESLLRLTRLLQAQDQSKARSYTEQALEQASRLGPRLAGQVHLKVGVLWAELDPQASQAWLQRAASLADKVNDPVLSALTKIATAINAKTDLLGEEPLDLILRPSNLSELAESVEWLVPGLLRWHGEQVERALQRWTIDFPEVFQRHLHSGSLEPSQAVRAIEVLGRSGAPSAADTLQPLLGNPQREVSQAAAKAISEISSVTRSAPLLRFFSLGEFQVFKGTEPADGWKTQKVKYLLAYLVGSNRSKIADDVLIEAFWPNSDAARGKKSLNTALSFLRSHLRKELGVDNFVTRTPEGLSVNTEITIWHDVDEFERLAQEASKLSKTDPAGMAERLRRLMDLYQGHYLDGCYMEFAVERRMRLERVITEAMPRLTSYYAGQGQFEEAVETGLRALELDPCQETVAMTMFSAYQKLGRREEAARLYSTFCQSLEEELGLEPSDEFIRLAEA